MDQCGLWDAERGEQPTTKKVNEDTKEEPDETKTKEPLVVLSSGLYRDVDWRWGSGKDSCPGCVLNKGAAAANGAATTEIHLVLCSHSQAQTRPGGVCS